MMNTFLGRDRDRRGPLPPAGAVPEYPPYAYAGSYAVIYSSSRLTIRTHRLSLWLPASC